MILAGIWFGNLKPIPNLFLKSFEESLSKLREGVEFTLWNKIVVSVKAMIICGTCDLPGKAIFLNFKQHNGYFGCPRCKLQGKHINNVHVYPYTNKLNLRTSQDTIQTANKITSEAIEGVKGPSFLRKIAVNFVEFVAADVMHCAFINLPKRLCSIWFDTKNHDHEGSLRTQLNKVNKRIKSLQVLDFLPRIPRALEDFNYWKASEMKWFLLCFSLPIFHDIMNEKYFDHHVLLIHALTILMASSISEADLQKAQRCLQKYVKDFKDLYGELNMTCNLHQLLHLVETVRKFGPLWVSSCFPFENLNGILKSLVKGSKKPELQICNAAYLMNRFLHLKDDLGLNTDVARFCDDVMNRSKRRKLLKKINEDVAIVGKCSKEKSTEDLEEIEKEVLGTIVNHSTKIYTFNRLIFKNILYETEEYCKKKNDSTPV